MKPPDDSEQKYKGNYDREPTFFSKFRSPEEIVNQPSYHNCSQTYADRHSIAYDLKNDPGENTNLANKRPDIIDKIELIMNQEHTEGQ